MCVCIFVCVSYILKKVFKLNKYIFNFSLSWYKKFSEIVKKIKNDGAIVIDSDFNSNIYNNIHGSDTPKPLKYLPGISNILLLNNNCISKDFI